MRACSFGLIVALVVLMAPAATARECAVHKLVFVLSVTDEGVYREYRSAIRPIMERLGIVVLQEYRISAVLHSPKREHQVNLLAVFGFPSDAALAAFFNDQAYLEAKSLFEASTENFSILVE